MLKKLNMPRVEIFIHEKVIVFISALRAKVHVKLRFG